MENQPRIINCHTHVFVHKIIPPQIGKSFMPWPLYTLFTTGLILRLAKLWYSEKPWSPTNKNIKYLYRRIQIIIYSYRSFVKRTALVNLLVNLFNWIAIINAIYFVFRNAIQKILSFNQGLLEIAIMLKNWLIQYHLLFPDLAMVWKVLLIAFVFLFLKTGRKILIGILKNTVKLASLWPDQKTIDFYKRYINIGRFANYKKSSIIYSKLQRQYPSDAGFVLLPMDMHYMGAGKVSDEGDFRLQMEELAGIKKNHPDKAYPFLFIDPRRIKSQSDFLSYTLGNGRVTLKECMVKEYMEDKKFNGFKIYPALGYYPFDEDLLILWKYAADHQLPIMTHAIRGTIFYRGTKKKEWGYHPVFTQTTGRIEDPPEPLLLPELKNVNYINNFTHPLNYLCLVEERMLRKLVAKCRKEIQDFFGYTNAETPLLHNLSHLKLCFAHYGGDDEWTRYLDKDRYDYSQQIIHSPSRGIEFLKDSRGDYTEAKLEDIWRFVDWYSIISSLMVQYDHLYADISYILHQQYIYPLLKESINSPYLKTKVLFGSDFYVVRNHKSEKEMLSQLEAGLSPAQFDQIARINPLTFLQSPNFP